MLPAGVTWQAWVTGERWGAGRDHRAPPGV